MNLIEKIDEMIKKLFDGPSNDATQNMKDLAKIEQLREIKEFILSEQKDLSQTLTDIYNEYPYKVVGRSDTYSKYNEAWTDAANRVAEVLGVDF